MLSSFAIDAFNERLSAFLGRPTEAMQKIVEQRKANLKLALHGISRVAGPKREFYDQANQEAQRLGAIISKDTRFTDHMPVVHIAFNTSTGECPADLSNSKIEKVKGTSDFAQIKTEIPDLSDSQAITLLMMRHIHGGTSRAISDNFNMYNDGWRVMDEFGVEMEKEKYE